jgi:sugar lactone lactonase YvrE
MRHSVRGCWIALAVLCSARTAPAQDMRLSNLLVDGQDWELVAEGFTFTEGPAADLEGNLYFTDVFRGRIHRINSQGKAEVFVEPSGGTNGLMFGPDGRLYGCQNGKQRIVAFDSAGKETAVVEGVKSNDLVVMGSGAVYFTDPENHQIWYVSPDGKKRVVDKGLGYPNGLILTPDQGTLVVVDMQSPNVYTYRVEPDGSLKFKQPFYTLRAQPGKLDCGADGMTVDSAGRLYIATQVGLQVLDTSGRVGGVINKPQVAWLSNAAFGGPNLDTLYVTCTNRVFKRKINAHGVRYFDTSSSKPAGGKRQPRSLVFCWGQHWLAGLFERPSRPALKPRSRAHSTWRAPPWRVGSSIARSVILRSPSGSPPAPAIARRFVG